MASYFTLQLDTTPPLVEIYAPTYTVRGVDNEVEVVANEELSLYQEIYVIDSLGVRHDLIFSHEGDVFSGVVNFDGYPVGNASIYAVVKDTLFNKSKPIFATINIISDIDAMRMTVIVDSIARDISLKDMARAEVIVSSSDIAT